MALDFGVDALYTNKTNHRAYASKTLNHMSCHFLARNMLNDANLGMLGDHSQAFQVDSAEFLAAISRTKE